MSEYITIGLLLSILAAQGGTFRWLIKHIEGIRKELTKMHTNDLFHIDQKIDKIQADLINHRITDHSKKGN